VSGDRPGWDDAAMIERVELELMHLRDEDGGTPTFWELAEAAYGVIAEAVRADECTRIAARIEAAHACRASDTSDSDWQAGALFGLALALHVAREGGAG
jgi:hypothetical protein